MSPFSIHLNLGKHWKSNMVSQRTERLYLIVALWLLRTELIAWKAQNGKPAFSILLVQPLKF